MQLDIKLLRRIKMFHQVFMYLLSTTTLPRCIHNPRESLMRPSRNLSLNNFDTFYESLSIGNRSVDICCTCCVVKSMPLNNCPILCRPSWSSAGPKYRRFCNIPEERERERRKVVVIKMQFTFTYVLRSFP